jgi:molybdopterin molybdotransferase
LVGFVLFARPARDALAGRPVRGDRTIAARLASAFAHSGDRPVYHPSRLSLGVSDGELPVVEPMAWAGSADLWTVANADGFAAFPAGDRRYRPGEIVRFLPLG